jgi:hypothetical protein
MTALRTLEPCEGARVSLRRNLAVSMSLAPAPGELAQLPFVGHSRATKATKLSAVAAFNRFLAASQGKYNAPWEGIDVEIICSQQFWCEWAYWGVHVTDPSYTSGTLVEYTRKFMGVLEDAYKGANPSFFQQVRDDASTNWYKGLIGQICVAKFEEARLSGEAVQKQAPPIYREHREDISRKLRLQGEQEYQLQNCVIQLNGSCAGRPGERCLLTLYDIRIHWCVLTQMSRGARVSLSLNN